MRKAILTAFLLLFAATAVAIEQPPSELKFDVIGRLPFSITQPPPPTVGECYDLWAISNVRCSGDLLFYDQCTATMEGGEWQGRSENCKAYGAEWTCYANECMQLDNIPLPDQPETIRIALAGLVIVGAALYFLTRKRGGKRK